MIGMPIAVVTTLVTHSPIASGSARPGLFDDWRLALEILAAIAIGAVIGLITARRIQMTAMPQLVAAFHSLVGLAAVLVAAAAFLNPDAFGILGLDGNILTVSRIEMALGAAIGAITFSGSVIAFAKLNGNMSGAPILLPARHVINLGTLVAILGLTAFYALSPDAGPGEGWVFWIARRARLRDRLPADHPDRRGGHAGRGLDAQLATRAGPRRRWASRCTTPR